MNSPTDMFDYYDHNILCILVQSLFNVCKLPFFVYLVIFYHIWAYENGLGTTKIEKTSEIYYITLLTNIFD